MIDLKKIQSVYGIYKKHGREAFLSAAEHYSDNVDWNSVEKTVSNMESTWYSDKHNLTEAEKMVKDMDTLFTKHIPATVREYFDMKNESAVQSDNK